MPWTAPNTPRSPAPVDPLTAAPGPVTGPLDLLPAVGALPHGVAAPDPRAAMQYQRTREMTIDEIMLENRVVFLIGEINHISAARVMMQMLYLEDQKRGREINLYINSPGGAVDDTLALYDTMQFISSKVATYCIGRAYSGGAVLLCAGTAGRRHILPHAKVMIHQPYGGVTGQTTDVQIQAEQIIKAKRTLNEIIARHSGRSPEEVERDGERDKFFSAQEAKDYGLVDEVFEAGKKEENGAKGAKGARGAKGEKGEAGSSKQDDTKPA